jgi:hypothetical protein
VKGKAKRGEPLRSAPMSHSQRLVCRSAFFELKLVVLVVKIRKLKLLVNPSATRQRDSAIGNIAGLIRLPLVCVL